MALQPNFGVLTQQQLTVIKLGMSHVNLEIICTKFVLQARAFHKVDCCSYWHLMS